MGNHRASIEIKFEAHGLKFKQEWWINYWPDSNGVDERLTEWLKETWEKCLNQYRERTDEGRREQAAKEKELRRLAYQDLKAEFEADEQNDKS